MAKNETDSGLFVALNHFSHLTLCLSEKMRHCFKSSDIFEKTSDFFHALAVTDSTKGCRQKKQTVYLKTFPKLRLTPLPPTLFLTNLFLTKC